MKKKFNIFIIIFILILVLPAQAKNYYKTDEWVENNRNIITYSDGSTRSYEIGKIYI